MMATQTAQSETRREPAGSGSSEQAERRLRILWWAAGISFVLGILVPVAVSWAVTARLNVGRTSPSWRLGASDLYESMMGSLTAGLIAGLVLGIAGLVLVARSGRWYQETGRSGCAPMSGRAWRSV